MIVRHIKIAQYVSYDGAIISAREVIMSKSVDRGKLKKMMKVATLHRFLY